MTAHRHGFDGVERRGLMFVLSSPSGAGKTTLSRLLIERTPGLKMSVSATTRPMRPGEVDGHDYRFIGKGEFEAMAGRGIVPAVIGTAIESDLARGIAEYCPQAVDLTDRTSMPELGGLARRAWGAVGNDTGPTNLIAAVGCPTVVVFSDASNPIHSTGPRVLIHHRPDFADIDSAGVVEALDRARNLGGS